MSIEIQIINIINDKLKNPIYTTMKLLTLRENNYEYPLQFLKKYIFSLLIPKQQL